MQQDAHKTNTQLLDELRELRQRNIELETSLANSKEAEANLRAVSETSLDAVIISDQEGNIIFWNKTATEIFGYEKEEVLGNPITMLISDEAMGEYKEGKEHVLERGFSLFGKRPKESLARRKDGTIFPAAFTVSNWKIKDNYYFGGSLRDISEQKRIEQEYESILNMSRDLICIAAADGYFKYVNPAWERTLGYPTEHLLSRPFLDFIHPEDHQKNDDEVARLVSGMLTVDFENRYIHKDGSIRIVQWTAAPLPEKGLWYCIGRDITERNQHEEALKESEERFRAVVESSSDAILISDQNGTITFWNRASAEMFGYEERGIVGKSYTNLLPERLRDQDQKAWQQFFKTGMLSNNKKPFETIALRKDSSEFPIEITFSGWKVQGQYCFSFIVRDITERKQHEEALREREERFRSITESSTDGIITTDSSGKILYWNKAAEKIYGYTAKEIVGKSIALLRPEGKRLIDRKNRARFISTGHSCIIGKTVEGFAARKDGTEFLTETSTSYWKAKGQIFFSGIVRDITERKRTENALQQEKYFSDTLINSLPGVFYLLDEQGHFIRWNKQTEDVTGYSAKELQYINNLSTIHKDDRALVASKMKDVFVNGQAAEVEARLLGRNGKVSHYYFTGKRVDIKEQSYLTGLGIDITELKRIEQELKQAHDQLEIKVKQRTGELAKTNKELQISKDYLKKFSGKLLSVREEERKNISTTLHDELGSMAISVDSQISIAKEECKENNKQGTFKALEQAQAALRKAVEDLRRLAVDLRPPNLEIVGLAPALTEFFDNFRKHSTLKITFRNDLAKKKIPGDTAIVIYRVIQEALTNITKHAKAQKVSMRLYLDKNKVHLDITDDGVGFDVDKVSKRKGKLKIGIQGMRERVESMGGEFMIKSAFKEGTQLKAALPKK